MVTIKAIQGVRSLDKQLITLYPGSVPSKLPNAEFWSKQSFDLIPLNLKFYNKVKASSI